MDLTTMTPGGIGVGTFTGTLSGIPVHGSMVGPGAGFTAFNSPLALGIGGTTIDDSSPQHSYAGIYTPITPLSDRVGFSAGAGPTSARVRMTFGSPIVDPTFHIANLDKSFLDFAPSVPLGLTTMTVLSGNGGGGDGLAFSPLKIFDALPATIDTTAIVSPPPLIGSRSAYGSILLSGTFSSLEFDIVTPSGIENATFTLSTNSVPEPSSLAVMATSALIAALRWRKRMRRQPPNDA